MKTSVFSTLGTTLKEAFFSLKTNKSPGYDDINFNIVKKCFGETIEPLKHLLNLSPENKIFPENTKIAKVKNTTFQKWLL